MKHQDDLLSKLAQVFQDLFYESYRTVLRGGYDEPFYLAPIEGQNGEIRFRHDFLRSALHEISHWLVAGDERRNQDDFGYWYAPDGRDLSQQSTFFKVEVKPQAIEWTLCETLGLEFDISADNLNPVVSQSETFKAEVEAFKAAIRTQKALYEQEGLPLRARSLVNALKP